MDLRTGFITEKAGRENPHGSGSNPRQKPRFKGIGANTVNEQLLTWGVTLFSPPEQHVHPAYYEDQLYTDP